MYSFSVTENCGSFSPSNTYRLFKLFNPTHFESKPEFAGKVNVVIVSAIVDGPEYSKDFKDKKKYKPYQFVGLKTE